MSGSHGTVTYAQSTGTSDLKVSSSGKISAAATLAAGTYKATGIARDTYGDTGAWSFALTVTANKITQIAPTAATTELGNGFAGQLESVGRTWDGHLHTIGGSASAHRLALRCDQGRSNLAGGNLQGSGHDERHTR